MHPSPRRKPRNLTLDLVEALGTRIREGALKSGDKLPSEAAIMADFGVSRTVVRESLSRLQAAGLVETRHGIGTFVLNAFDSPVFRPSPEQLGTLRDVIALVELRIGIETEAASLAAARRTETNLQALESALQTFQQAIEAGQDAVAADLHFHQEIAHATQNPHFAELMHSLGAGIIPRARLEKGTPPDSLRLAYLRRVHHEHENILSAIRNQDVDAARAAMRTHLSNSRDRLRTREYLPTHAEEREKTQG